MKGLNTRLRNLQRRLGRREELVAGVVLGVLAASGLAFTLVTNQGTPAGAALAYLAAVDRADTDYVWKHSVIDSAKASGLDASLLDRAALAAQLASTAHGRSAFNVQDVSSLSTGTRVTISYTTSEGRQTTSLVMRDSSPHSWPVLVQPVGLDVKIPNGAGGLAIDGMAVAASPGGAVKIAVFPGTHKVSLAGSHLYMDYAGLVDSQSAVPALTPLAFTKVRVTEAATTEAREAVGKVIKACAGSNVLSPPGCPQSFRQDLANGAVSWTLLGDPVGAASVGLDDKSTLVVTSHFLMQLSYRGEISRRQRNLAVGAPFIAALDWDGQALKVSGFQDASGVAQVARPAVTDAQILSTLKTQWDSCLNLQGGSSPECPQVVFALYASNFTWHQDSDPFQGAVLAWDGARAIFTVSGNFAMSVDYDSKPPISPTRRIHDSSSGQYVADLYWNGSIVGFIGFEK